MHEAVLKSGARFSGPTVHFVDEHYDTGRAKHIFLDTPILFPIHPSLSARKGGRPSLLCTTLAAWPVEKERPSIGRRYIDLMDSI